MSMLAALPECFQARQEQTMACLSPEPCPSSPQQESTEDGTSRNREKESNTMNLAGLHGKTKHKRDSTKKVNEKKANKKELDSLKQQVRSAMNTVDIQQLTVKGLDANITELRTKKESLQDEIDKLLCEMVDVAVENEAMSMYVGEKKSSLLIDGVVS